MVFKSSPRHPGGISILVSRSPCPPCVWHPKSLARRDWRRFSSQPTPHEPNRFCAWGAKSMAQNCAGGKEARCRIARGGAERIAREEQREQRIALLHLPKRSHLCRTQIQREGRRIQREGRRRGRRHLESSPGARGLSPAAPAPWSSGSHPSCCKQSSPPTSTSRRSSARAPSAPSSTPPPHPSGLLAVHAPLPLPSSALLLMFGYLGHGYTLLYCASCSRRQTALVALLHCTYYITR
jgi:hypothetical protein